MAENNSSEKAIWFLAGMAIGAGVAILFAPKSGRETRRYISDKANDSAEYVADKGRRAYERGKELVDDVGELVERGRKAVERVRSGAAA